jgi:hypothetical protein
MPPAVCFSTSCGFTSSLSPRGDICSSGEGISCCTKKIRWTACQHQLACPAPEDFSRQQGHTNPHTQRWALSCHLFNQSFTLETSISAFSAVITACTRRQPACRPAARCRRPVVEWQDTSERWCLCVQPATHCEWLCRTTASESTARNVAVHGAGAHRREAAGVR